MFKELTLVLGALILVASSAVPAADTAVAVPADAMAIIDRVRVAAQNRDFATLQATMVKEFVWSSGGVDDSQQAIDAWRKEPTKYLSALAQVLGSPCAIDTGKRHGAHISCPGRSGTSFRAGFVNVDGGWKMAYFVEGG